jgi:hypothetical protein
VITLWFALLLAGVSPPVPAGPAADSTAAPADSLAAPEVVVYYFHTTSRCATCRKLEAYSREAVETGFPADLRSGRLAWKTVNIDEKGNKHFVKDYALYTKALILVDLRKGRETRWENLERIWELMHDKDDFLAYVQDGVRGLLSKTP